MREITKCKRGRRECRKKSVEKRRREERSMATVPSQSAWKRSNGNE